MYTHTYTRINMACSQLIKCTLVHNGAEPLVHVYKCIHTHRYSFFLLQGAGPSAVSWLRYASNELRDNLDIGLIAVKSNGLALDQAGQGGKAFRQNRSSALQLVRV